MAEGQWWWCLVHRRAEAEPDATGADRLGPYATEEQAADALGRVASRNDEWDNDPAWRDD